MKHYLNGVEVSPREIGLIGFKTNFTGRNSAGKNSELELNVDRLKFTREGFKMIQDHVEQNGFFKGIPYSTTLGSIQIEYYLDLQSNPIFSDYEVEAPVIRRKANKAFFNLANDTSFASMAQQGVIFNSTDAGYVIIKDSQLELALTLTLSLYTLSRELINQTRALTDAITQLTDAVTPNVGFVSMDLGGILSLILKVTAQIAFISLLVVAIVNLGQQLFDLIFPKVRYLKATKVKELLTKGCEHLNYQFQSTLLDSVSGLSIMPKPLKKQERKWFSFVQNDLNQSFNNAFPSAQDTTPNLGSLVTAMENYFNCKARVYNGKVYLESDEYWENNTSNVITTALSNQDDRTNEYGVNTNEAWRKYYITYQPDITDLFTYDDFDGNDAEYNTSALNVSEPDLDIIQGFKKVSIPFALAKRKGELNWLEKQAREVFEFIDNASATFGGNASYVAKIDARKGVMTISQQYFTTTKMLYLVGDKQPENYLNYISATEIWNRYHYTNQIQLNGYKVYNQVRAIVSYENYVNLLQNNFATINGVADCEILEMDYISLDNAEADGSANILISYKEPYPYAYGKVATIKIN